MKLELNLEKIEMCGCDAFGNKCALWEYRSHSLFEPHSAMLLASEPLVLGCSNSGIH